MTPTRKRRIATETSLARGTKKRVRETWPGGEIDHVWAHQKASYGRSIGKSVFFDGPTIFSYGRHFPMARLLLKKGKPDAVLLTTRTYSVTTSGHQSDVRSAVQHLTQFHVEDVLGDDHRKRLAEYRERVKDAAEAVKKAKAATLRNIEALDRLIREANEYATYFGLKTRFAYPEGFDREAERVRGVEEARKQAERDAVRDERRRERYERQEAARKAAHAKAVAEYPAKLAEYEQKVRAWLAGAGETFPTKPQNPERPYESSYGQPALLRVRGSRVQTSLGAVVQVEAAKPLLALVRRAGTGVTELPDFEIDGYRGGRIDYDGKTVRVGCHTIAFAEVERIAAELKL